MLLQFFPIHVFLAAPQVSLFDVGVNGSNVANVVIPQKMLFIHLITTILSSIIFFQKSTLKIFSGIKS